MKQFHFCLDMVGVEALFPVTSTAHQKKKQYIFPRSPFAQCVLHTASTLICAGKIQMYPSDFGSFGHMAP